MTTHSDALVVFGATGDLASKQIFPALVALAARGRLDLPVVGVGRSKLTAEELLATTRENLEKSRSFDVKGFERLAKVFRYVVVDYDDPSSFAGIRKAIGDAKAPLHYVALPPDLFEKVAGLLAKAALAKGARLALEKPFGHDRASAQALSEALHASFSEESIFRLDHYLGKEQVANLVYFRAANPLVERTLHRGLVSGIEITMAETFGVEGRAAFYDKVGAVRDVVQNHLLELLACLTMEVPEGRGHAALRDARTKLLAQVRAVAKEDIVRGQVHGYTSEKGVAKTSTTETFAVLRTTIDSPRWDGVPITIRTGKALQLTATEAVVRFSAPAHAVLEDDTAPPPNHLRFQIGPKSLIALGTNVKKNGAAMAGVPSEMLLCHDTTDAMKPYERLLGDAMTGDATQFAHRTAVEESWRIVDAALAANTPAYPYEAKSWGPSEAVLLDPAHGWLPPRL